MFRFRLFSRLGPLLALAALAACSAPDQDARATTDSDLEGAPSPSTKADIYFDTKGERITRRAVEVSYDRTRLTRNELRDGEYCRAPGSSVHLKYLIDGQGVARDIKLQGSGQYMSATLAIDDNASRVVYWFESRGPNNCLGYDSRKGRNFDLDVAALTFGRPLFSDVYVELDGVHTAPPGGRGPTRLAAKAGETVRISYDHRRFLQARFADGLCQAPGSSVHVKYYFDVASADVEDLELVNTSTAVGHDGPLGFDVTVPPTAKTVTMWFESKGPPSCNETDPRDTKGKFGYQFSQ